MPVSSKRNRGPSAGPENRAALIAAAREVFAESGLMAPLSAVARRAGVGQGSLYRHFPDRTALAIAVFEDNVTQLEALAAASDTSLSDLFDSITEQAMGSTAMIDMMSSDPHDPRTQVLGTRVRAVIDRMLDRDRSAGIVGSHVESADIEVAISMLAFLLARTDAAERPEVAARARTIFRASFAPA